MHEIEDLRRENEDLKSQLRTALKDTEWQAIETAPKTVEWSKPIMVRAWMGGREVHAYWDSDKNANHPRPFWNSYYVGRSWCRANQPTHWMPLAKPPVLSPTPTQLTMTNDTNSFPRRSDLLRMTPAELAIHNAVLEVEKVGADVRLTDAVILLGQAQGKVADYVDGLSPTTGTKE